jgi:cyclophilin family peptidyl-prolyl cis-trans isomerase
LLVPRRLSAAIRNNIAGGKKIRTLAPMKQLRLAAQLFLWAGCVASLWASETASLPDGMYAEITTPRGVIVAELFYRQVPLTVTSFVGLAEGKLGPKKGTPFYDGLTFHRVVPNFVIQGGDPLGTGEGGPGYVLPDEFVPGLHHDAVGVFSMANEGPDTNGCQFFITLEPVNRLNYLHTVFGRTVQGLDVLPHIQAKDTMQVKILRVGAEAQAFQVDEAALAARLAEHRSAHASTPAAAPAHFEDSARVLPTEPPRAKALNDKLINFERGTGQKVYARLLASFAPEQPDQTKPQFIEALATKLGLAARGALVVYFADSDEWQLWIGAEDRATFEAAADGSFDDRVARFFTAAHRAADVAVERFRKPLPAGQTLKTHFDFVLDGLIGWLESHHG